MSKIPNFFQNTFEKMSAHSPDFSINLESFFYLKGKMDREAIQISLLIEGKNPGISGYEYGNVNYALVEEIKNSPQIFSAIFNRFAAINPDGSIVLKDHPAESPFCKYLKSRK